MSQPPFKTVRVRYPQTLVKESLINKHNLYRRRQRLGTITSRIAYPAGFVISTVFWYSMSVAYLKMPLALFEILTMILSWAMLGGVIGFVLQSILFYTVLKIGLNKTERELYASIDNTAHSMMLEDGLVPLKRAYVSKDKAITYGYEYINMNASTSQYLILNIPYDLQSANDLSENDPAMRQALTIYIKDHRPDDAFILNIISGIMPTITHRENQTTQSLTGAFHQHTSSGGLLIKQLNDENQSLQSEIKSLESSLAQQVNQLKSYHKE